MAFQAAYDWIERDPIKCAAGGAYIAVFAMCAIDASQCCPWLEKSLPVLSASDCTNQRSAPASGIRAYRYRNGIKPGFVSRASGILMGTRLQH